MSQKEFCINPACRYHFICDEDINARRAIPNVVEGASKPIYRYDYWNKNNIHVWFCAICHAEIQAPSSAGLELINKFSLY